jgi:hypothetical protein
MCLRVPFGTIKPMTTGGRFLTRGLQKVSGEVAPGVLAYSIIPAVNLIGATALEAGLPELSKNCPGKPLPLIFHTAATGAAYSNATPIRKPDQLRDRTSPFSICS